MANHRADRIGMTGVVEDDRRDDQAADSARSPAALAWRAKRWLDLSLALLLLVVLSPVMILVALIIKLDSAGPVIYRQERIGQYGRPFHILKFRTIAHGAPTAHHRKHTAAIMADRHRQAGADHATKPARPFKDPNITRVGHWLRKSSLDELPQLVNVVRGEMSLVGPRPRPPYEIAGLTDRERRRLEVPQGMTGLWQVSGRSALPYFMKSELDLKYVDHWSMWLDLCVLLKTPKSIFDWDKTA